MQPRSNMSLTLRNGEKRFAAWTYPEWFRDGAERSDNDVPAYSEGMSVSGQKALVSIPGRWALMMLVVCLMALGFSTELQAFRKPPAHHATPNTKKATGKKAGTQSIPGSTKSRSAHSASSTKGSRRRNGSKSARAGRHSAVTSRAEAQKNLKIRSAFVASEQLRPMAQQLAATRSPAAYQGVEAYARQHTGEAAAAAYLALGHAAALDRRYGEAIAAFRQANSSGEVLDDYADFLDAQAAYRANRGTEAYSLLENFEAKYPDSIFIQNAPLLLANLHLQQNDGQGAVRALEPLQGAPISTHADYLFTLARAYQVAGDTSQAATLYRKLLLKQPLSNEAVQSRQQMQAMSMDFSLAELKVQADQMFNAKRYGEASDLYHAIARNSSSLTPADRDALAIYAAVCDLKLKRLSRHEVEKLPDTGDDSAALKLYLLSELSRNEGNTAAHDRIVTDMLTRFPASRWLEEALYSGGNMYLLKHESNRAAERYSQLTRMFPTSTYAPSAHWRWTWVTYRMRRLTEAAGLMDEQILRYPAGIEVPAALYWRARIYETEESNAAAAYAYYHAISESYCNFYYAELARRRMRVLGQQPALASSAVLAAVRRPTTPTLEESVPDDDPHVTKAKLLANAALNEYIGPEILASPTSASWGDLAQAEIYSSFGENSRALQSMKRSGISFFTQPVTSIPAAYWHILFPQPYWSDLVEQSQRNGLDPYLVASLIRQESEFNPGVVSHANAYGLMQLLPSVGKAIAKQQGVKPFDAGQLLDPRINLQLGTANLKQVINRYGGQLEYALAAYNAGDTPVRQWIASGDFKDVPEFVESIPYTETREYVQAILRNRELYHVLYPIRATSVQ